MGFLRQANKYCVVVERVVLIVFSMAFVVVFLRWDFLGIDNNGSEYFGIESDYEDYREGVGLEDVNSPPDYGGWYWQLDGGNIDIYRSELVYDIDLFETDREVISTLRNVGKFVICYFNAGAYEPYRPDSKEFSEVYMGKGLKGWSDERWLDISNYEGFSDIMLARLDLAKLKSCNAVEPDNVDGFENDTGFNISYDDQLKYNLWISEEAHKRGLSIGLKNNLSQVARLEPYFDFAINEECFYYGECGYLSPFISSGKPVFGVEYKLKKSDFCEKSIRLGYVFARADTNLSGDWDMCK